MKKNFKILRILIKTFGFKFKYIGIIIFRLFVELLIGISQFFDDLFFPKYRKVELKSPIFLIGHPRSGTTFLHRFFEKSCPQIRTVYLWEMIFPSLILRKIAGMFRKTLGNISLDGIWDPKIHKTNMLTAETEDIALFFRYFDGFLSWIYFSLWEDYSSEEDFYKKLVEKCDKDKFIYYLEKLHKKNLLNSDRRMFSKSFALLFNIETIKRVFPDAKILLMIRDPLQSIASFMSLERYTQDKINGLGKADKSLQEKYYKGIYLTSLYYFKKVHEFMTSPEGQDDTIMLITHKQLLSNFDVVLNDIISRFGLEYSPELKDAIKTQMEKQKSFKSEHKYSYDEFGFTEEQIKRDFSFVYENYEV